MSSNGHYVIIPIEKCNINKIINTASKLKETSGVDDINASIWKLILNCIALLLNFQSLYWKGALAQNFKILKTLIPIHKSGDKAQVTNYSPISLI